MSLIGKKGRKEVLVTESNTAAAAGSGLLPVFATPHLVALMENAARDAIEADIPEGCSTVGTMVDIRHTSATPVGMRVWAEATVTEEDGRRLRFHVEAFDEHGGVGTAEHERFIVDIQRFMKKAGDKLPEQRA